MLLASCSDDMTLKVNLGFLKFNEENIKKSCNLLSDFPLLPHSDADLEYEAGVMCP